MASSNLNEWEYLHSLCDIRDYGIPRDDRTGTGTKGLFGLRMEFNLQKGFPLITTKSVHFKSIVHELIWFLRGDTNIGYLQQNKVKIWDKWADENGDLGPVYGAQWRRFSASNDTSGHSVDQIANLVETIKTNPMSRRMVVSAWNPLVTEDMTLPPCHVMFQVYCSTDRVMSIQVYQRSADMFLGIPFNIASYALLLHLLAKITNYKVGKLIHVIGDAHIYNNHTDAVNTQLMRVPNSPPTISIEDSVTSIDNINFNDIHLFDYNPQDAINAEVSV